MQIMTYKSPISQNVLHPCHVSLNYFLLYPLTWIVRWAKQLGEYTFDASSINMCLSINIPKEVMKTIDKRHISSVNPSSFFNIFKDSITSCSTFESAHTITEYVSTKDGTVSKVKGRTW